MAACWTGPVAPPPAAPAPTPPPPLALDVRLERTQCFGRCPEYVVEIHGDGNVVWTGRANVAAIGMQHRHVERRKLLALEREIERSGFFELDEYGHPPTQPACIRSGNSVTCSFNSVSVCSDTSHAMITVRRGLLAHTIDDAHCGDDTALDALEDLVDDIAGDAAWIGR